MDDHDSIRHIPIILAYSFISLFLILIGFILFTISHKLYKFLISDKNLKAKQLNQIIKPSSFSLSTKARKSLKEIKKSVVRPEDKPMKSLRKTTLG